MTKLGLILGATGLCALSTPAFARLQIFIDVAGVTFSCFDGEASCDTSSATGTLQLANQIIDGVIVNGSISSSGTSPQDFLNTSSTQVINTNTFAVPIDVTVSQTGYDRNVSSVDFSGSGTWQFASNSGVNSDITLSWYADAANGQGAPGTPGTLLGSFSNTSSGTVDSFNTTGSHAFLNTGGSSFSMTMDASGTLIPGGQLINRGQDMVAVPEPQTWALMALGFVGLGYAGSRRSRKTAILIA
jgi:hypothetical protein